MTRQSTLPRTAKLAGFVFAGAALIAFSSLLFAQPAGETPRPPSYSQAYCSGFISESQPPAIGNVVGAEEGSKKNDLSDGDLVYLGNGPVSSATVGAEYFVVRPLRKLKGIGTLFQDVGHVKVVDLHDNVAVARIVFNCVEMNVGDWVVTSQARPMPMVPPPTVVDQLAHASGKAEGSIIASKRDVVQLGQGQIAYLDVGTNKGIEPGSVLRIFRLSYRGSINDYNRSQVKKYAKTSNFPRQILGECVVLQAEPNTAVALITSSLEEINIGDRVELK